MRHTLRTCRRDEKSLNVADSDLEPGRPSPSRTKQELTSTTAGLGRSRTHD